MENLFDPDDILVIDIFIAEIIHGLSDEENTKTSNLAGLRRQSSVGLFPGEWVKRDPAVDQCDRYRGIVLIRLNSDRGIPCRGSIGIMSYIGEELIQCYGNLHVGFHGAVYGIQGFIEKIRDYSDIIDFCLNGKFFHNMFLLRISDRIIRFSSYLFYHNSAGIQSVFYKVSTNYQYLYL